MKQNATRLFLNGLAGGLLTLALALASVSRAAEPPCARAAEESAEALMRRATAAERAQRAEEAASAYERLLRRDATHEAVVAPRLVALYADCGHAAQALAWAARVARRQPEPKAYLAGVYARLGQWKEAELLLRQALSDVKEPDRRVPLLWQMADAQAQQGDHAAALATLTSACETAQGQDLQRTAARKRDSLAQRCPAAQAQTPPSSASPREEKTP